MTKKYVKEVLAKYDEKIVTWFKDEDGSIVCHTTDGGSIWQIIILPSMKYATRQMLSTAVLLKTHDISDLFFKEV